MFFVFINLEFFIIKVDFVILRVINYFILMFMISFIVVLFKVVINEG